MIIDWDAVIKQLITTGGSMALVAIPLAFQQWKTREEARAEAQHARAERVATAARLLEVKEEVVKVKENVDGHLSKLTASLAKSNVTNVALTVEADRLNEGTTTKPVTQTPAVGGPVIREDDGSYTLNERRKTDSPS
jgi:hypothetical protein